MIFISFERKNYPPRLYNMTNIFLFTFVAGKHPFGTRQKDKKKLREFYKIVPVYYYLRT